MTKTTTGQPQVTSESVTSWLHFTCGIDNPRQASILRISESTIHPTIRCGLMSHKKSGRDGGSKLSEDIQRIRAVNETDDSWHYCQTMDVIAQYPAENCDVCKTE